MTGTYNPFPRREKIWFAIPASMLETINIIGRQSASSEAITLSFVEQILLFIPFLAW